MQDATPGRLTSPANIIEAPGAEYQLDPFRNRAWVAAELVIAFAVGASLMSFFYTDSRGVPFDRIGVPEYDAYYHIKMASMLPEIGFVRDFPWLRFVYFSQLDDSFVSHHCGFHLLLLPFVKAAGWLYGDYLAGGRWAISFCFGLNLLLMDLLLISERIRWRWLWLIALLVLPGEFFGRHSYVRAIAPSLGFMLLTLWAIFRGRHVLAGLAIVGYTHLYLGSVVYSPVIVIAYVVASVIGPRGDRSIPWRLILWTSFGWLAGLRTYPYFNGALEFLRMQILGSGLDPDIPVGAEWYSYDNVWHFAFGMCGPMLAVWTAALLLRLRLGGRLNPKEMTLVILNFGFLLLTLKAKRFIEYWPAFCLLSAAFMAAPIVNRWAAWFDPAEPRMSGIGNAVRRLGLVGMAAVCLAALVHFKRPRDMDSFLAEWPLCTLLASAAVAIPLCRVWMQSGVMGDDRLRFNRSAAMTVLGCVAVFAAGLMLAGRWEFAVAMDHGHLGPGLIGWSVFAVSVSALVFVSGKTAATRTSPALLSRLLNSVTVMFGGVAAISAIVLLSAGRLSALQRDIRCEFDLPAIRQMMAFLKSVSRPGDVIFTDDWDVFPVYFYHNSYNNFIVGLDPKFTHSRNPEIWERYVKVTRGQVPRTFDAQWTGPDGKRVTRKLHVELTDIEEHFGARYVITDRDHKLLARKLAERPDFAKVIYPQTEYDQCADAPYLVFQVGRGAGGSASAPPPPRRHDAMLYLTELDPVSVQQGWGELTMDRSVEGHPIRLKGRLFDRGLGTHAPLELTYQLPDGFASFEAVVGIDADSDGKGNVVISVELDGREVLRSRMLYGDSAPVDISVPLGKAKRLTLRADAAGDNHFDHVDWADARLVPESP